MGILDCLKFSDGNTETSKIWENVWKYLQFILLILGFILWKTDYVRKIPLPLFGNTGTLGFLLFFGIIIYYIWKYRKEIEEALKHMKFFIVSVLSGFLILLFCRVYYFIRGGTVGSDLTNMLGLGQVGMKKKLNRNKKRPQSLPPGVPASQSDEQTNVQKQITNVLTAVLPGNVLSLIRQDYFKRIFVFLLVYVLSLNYFVISKTYTAPINMSELRKKGVDVKMSKEQYEIFWSIVRGFLFSLLICFFLTFRILMMKDYSLLGGFGEKNINEYVIVFSLITGFSTGLTKYLVKGPLAFLFNKL